MSTTAPNPFVDPDYQEPKDRLKKMVSEDIAGRPFSELSSVAFHHDGSLLAGHVLLDTLEEEGYSLDDFDAVGALTAAAVPFVTAMIQAAGARGQVLDGFVLDFVFPGIKGPSISGKKVILLDAWLSEKSYIQTSSLVTLKNGNELNLDFAILKKLGADVVAIAALVGGSKAQKVIDVVSPLDDSATELPFIHVFDQDDVAGARVNRADEGNAHD
ncbi:MAG: orotate phosphoribosyltransferase [Bifidobacteriaceae bacterium]|jgi:hypothetical protein|nr:orotate phosphoribosyltransferase [Bifidobacteriaceae bacterium]